MGWLVKPQKIYLDLVSSWLRSEIAKLTHVVTAIEETKDVHDAVVRESVKAAETGLSRIRKFINVN